MTPFDFIKAITYTKENLFLDAQAAKDYRKSSWIINRGLSQNPDTILYANEMNKYYFLPEDWKFSFYLNSIPKKQRYAKWAKKDPAADSLKLVMEYFSYSSEKAEQALSILSEAQLAMIKEKLYKGGK